MSLSIPEGVIRRGICDAFLAKLGGDFSLSALASLSSMQVKIQEHILHRNKLLVLVKILRALPEESRKNFLQAEWSEESQHVSNKVRRIALRTYQLDMLGLSRRLFMEYPRLDYLEVVTRPTHPTQIVLKFTGNARVRIDTLAKKLEEVGGHFQGWVESDRNFKIYGRGEYEYSAESKLINETKRITLRATDSCALSADTPWQPYEMLTKTRLDDLERQSQYEQYKEKPAPSDQAASASPTKAVETSPVSASAAPGLPMKPSASIGLLLGDAVAVELQRLSSKRAPPSGAVISREVDFLLRDNSLPAPANAIRIRAPRFDLWNPVSESRLEQMRSGYQRAYAPPPYCPCTEDSSSLGGDSPPVVADGGGAPTDDGIDSAHAAQDLRDRLGWSSLPICFLLPCCHESVCCSPCRSSGC